MRFIRTLIVPAVFVLFVIATPLIHAQGVGNSASISGAVLDPTGAVVPKATVEIHNVVSGLDRSTTTDNMGNFSFVNVPYNPYHLSVNASGFAPYGQDVDVRSSVNVNLKISLSLAGQTSSLTVEASGVDLIETESTAHTDVDRELFDKLPSPHPESRRIRMGFSMEWAITRRIHFPWTASPSLTSRARFSRTRFRLTRSNP
jgi:hypothetical protein